MNERAPYRYSALHLWARSFNKEARESLNDLQLPLGETLQLAGMSAVAALRVR